MKFADHSGRLAEEFDPFADEPLGDMIAAVALAWTKIKRIPEIENRITKKLAGRLMNDEAFRDLPFVVDAQKMLIDLDGNETGRPDLVFRHRSSHRAYFAFEAKRLHVVSEGGNFSDEYATFAGLDGMEAFTTQQYSAGLPAAGMLGYVMDGRTSEAWAGLSRIIDKRRERLRMSSSACLEVSSLSQYLAHGVSSALLGETFHQLSPISLRLLHLLLPM